MIFSKDPAARLNAADNILNRPEIVHKIMNAHKKGHPTTPIPDFLKPLIAASAVVENQDDVAESFDVSQASVSAISRGFASYGDVQHKKNPDAELMEKTDKRVEKIGELALSKLADSLGLIDHEKLEGEKPQSLSKIARDMAAVYKDVRPNNQIAENIGQVIVMAPSQRELRQYEVIDVESREIA